MTVCNILITGSNSGCGFDCARQLALRGGVQKIILGCRNIDKANVARANLEKITGKTIFEILIIDVSSLESVRKAVQELKEPIDALIMNAGGFGNRETMLESGVINVVALNILGHVLLFDLLIEQKKLVSGGTAIYVSSEVARGMPGIQRYEFKDGGSVSEFKSLCDGSGCGGDSWSAEQYYGCTKMVAIMDTWHG